MDSEMKTIKTLDNGKTVRRDDYGRLWLYDESGLMMGMVLQGSLAAQLLALTPEDFGQVEPVASTSTVSVPGPADGPRKGPQRLIDRYRAAMAAWRAGR